jgi:hypothetical protein
MGKRPMGLSDFLLPKTGDIRCHGVGTGLLPSREKPYSIIYVWIGLDCECMGFSCAEEVKELIEDLMISPP